VRARITFPFFYGWVIVACAACAGFARQGAAVATLSVFVTPMSMEFDWSRAEMSGAVSLGGVLGALVSPVLGSIVDRKGARPVLLVSTCIVTACAYGLSGIEGIVGFYVFFGMARMAFAGPFDVAVSTSLANWFERKRALAMSYASTSAAIALAVMPMVAQFAIDSGGWRSGWLVLAVSVFVVGAIPIALFMRRRPEDMGLVPDGGPAVADPAGKRRVATGPAKDFTRAQAIRTPTFWLLMLYTALVFCMQAGISLHQAPYLVELGISPTTAASIIGTFSLSAAAGALISGRLGDRFSIRTMLVAISALMVVASLNMMRVDSSASGFVAAILFGSGIGALMTLTPLAFAVHFGRTHYGAIRGFALPAQVVGQASGPLIAGIIRDNTGSYHAALATFACIGVCAVIAALGLRPPKTQSSV
jgi:MFS transporter, OFA family, oxalate/formate antiporter